MDPARTYFGAHCFAVFKSVNGDKVIDICHGILDQSGIVLLDGGTKDYDSYKIASIDQGSNNITAPVLSGKEFRS